MDDLDFGDLVKVAGALDTGDRLGASLRFATVVSVQTDYTATVRIAGATGTVPGVKYVASVLPVPGVGCVLLVDGTDLLIVDVVAAANRVPQPTLYGATQSIPTGTATAVTFNSATDDPFSMWTVATPTRCTIKAPGLYRLTGQVTYAANATGMRQLTLRLNGTTAIGDSAVTTTGAAQSVQVLVDTQRFTAGQYVDLAATQNSGSPLSVTTPLLTASYIGP